MKDQIKRLERQNHEAKKQLKDYPELKRHNQELAEEVARL